MDYQLSPEEVKLQQDLAAFCQAEIAPRAKMLDRLHARRGGRVHEGNLQMLAQGGWLEAGQAGDAMDLVDDLPGGRSDRKGLPGHLSERPGEHLPVRRGIEAVRHAGAESSNISPPS